MAKSRLTSFREQSFGDKAFIIGIYMLLVLFFFLVLLPLLYVISASLSDPQAVIEGRVAFWPVDPTFRGYTAVFSYSKIQTGFLNSFIYMFMGTLVNISMTLICAFPLSRKDFKHRRKISLLLMFTMIFSGGLIPTYIIVDRLGLVDTRWAMILPAAMSVWNVMIARTYMENSIPDELFDSASIDGCSPFTYFHKVVIPLAKPVIAVLVLYYGVGHWNAYFNALIYLRSQDLMPLQMILREILVVNKIDPALVTSAEALASRQGMQDLLKYSVIVVSSIPVLMIYPFVQRYFVEGVMIGSVKG